LQQVPETARESGPFEAEEGSQEVAFGVSPVMRPEQLAKGFQQLRVVAAIRQHLEVREA